MVRAIKRLNILQVISLIGLVIVGILCYLKVYNMINLFWFILSLNMLGYLLFTIKWTKEGKTNFSKLDQKYSKNLTRKPSDTIFFSCVAFFLSICILIIGDFVFRSVHNPLDDIFPLIISAYIVNIAGIVIVERTYREVVALIKKK